jgi:hypothetical protein
MQVKTSLAIVFALIAGLAIADAHGAPTPATQMASMLEKEWEQQYRLLLSRIAARGPKGEGPPHVAAQSLRPSVLVSPEDRDPVDVVLRQTADLLQALRKLRPDAFEKMAEELGALGAEVRAGQPQSVAPIDEPAGKGQVPKVAPPALTASPRHELYRRLCQLRRRIALSNPLLDSDSLLFIKRNGLGGNHMCDQYYGHDQTPGGGLFVLSDPFGPAPSLRDVLANSTVANGRLKGTKLAAGSFLSPALSYDGKRIAFAYVECAGPRGHEQHTDPTRGHWPAGWSYHVFSVNLDGSDLRMLTDGMWNDFSPCFMPSGRIAFISERRGGYLRCGRVCPTYTLFDMASDGTDVRCISYHETNEWAPSVTHDGMILWTRWDYVDRHGCVTHMPWLTTPDGRDPRPVHGNYAPRGRRADMETDARPIPGSHRFVATAAPHHGHSFGSLIMVDPTMEDDDAMAPVKRLTPEVSFPESEGKWGQGASYGQAWPLSEDFHLCVFKAGRSEPYGLYLYDTFGNRELLWRDPALHCLSPIPVKPRRVPPIVPELGRTASAQGDAQAVVGVVDVYRSLKEWPADTRIVALRVYQIFPLSLPSAAVFGRHETGLRIPQGADSINLTRAALGTVPVEADGSAHFIAPARKELFFQALDAKGLAVTSMRSGTHFLPGEKTTCYGCHEPKHRSPPAATLGAAIALRRPPSRIASEVEGSNPISFPLLVQPVLDKHCVGCHARSEGKAPPLDRSIVKVGQTEYFASYKSLAPKFGFYSYPDYHRSTPGQFGARASNLYAHLQKGHHDVKLTPQEMRRLTLWLDSASVFYGVYEPEGQKLELRGQAARPTLE